MAPVLYKIQLNLSTTGTLGTETRVNVWIFLSAGTKKSGRYRWFDCMTIATVA